MPYYPDQTSIARLTIIQRECRLPEEAIGKVTRTVGQAVDVRDIVAQGAITARHRILDGQAFFGLRDPEKLKELMLVRVGKAVKKDDPIAGKSADRGKRLMSPIDGLLTRVDNGRIILQEMPQLIDLQAGVRGQITAIYPGSGVAIQSTGAQVMGVWGNGHNSVIGSLRAEPGKGLSNIREEALDQRYLNAVIVSRKPLREDELLICEEQNVGGLIVPSMDASMIDRAIRSEVAIMLTEGFGTMRMSSAVYALLEEFAAEGHQITMDARRIGRGDGERPTAVISYRTSEKPPDNTFMLPLRKGQRVRVTRDPYIGYQGKILDLPKNPILLDNGLRVHCAKVEIRGQSVDIPLANLEVAGR